MKDRELQKLYKESMKGVVVPDGLEESTLKYIYAKEEQHKLFIKRIGMLSKCVSAAACFAVLIKAVTLGISSVTDTEGGVSVIEVTQTAVSETSADSPEISSDFEDRNYSHRSQESISMSNTILNTVEVTLPKNSENIYLNESVSQPETEMSQPVNQSVSMTSLSSAVLNSSNDKVAVAETAYISEYIGTTTTEQNMYCAEEISSVIEISDTDLSDVRKYSVELNQSIYFNGYKSILIPWSEFGISALESVVSINIYFETDTQIGDFGVRIGSNEDVSDEYAVFTEVAVEIPHNSYLMVCTTDSYISYADDTLVIDILKLGCDTITIKNIEVITQANSEYSQVPNEILEVNSVQSVEEEQSEYESAISEQTVSKTELIISASEIAETELTIVESVQNMTDVSGKRFHNRFLK